MKGIVVLLLVIAGIWIEARAEPCAWAVLTVGSKHINEAPGKDYNERNWGAGGEHCIGTVLGYEIRGAAGFFRNSNRIDSFYWGGSVTLLEYGPAKFGVALMRVSGYDIDPITAPFPVLAIEPAQPGITPGINLSYFPKSRSTSTAIGLQAKWRWR